MGSTVTGDINGRPVPLAVVGLFAEGRGSSFSNGVTTLSALAAAGVPVADQMLGVQRRPDADAASVQAGVQRAVADLPMVTVADRAGYAAAQAAQVDRLLGLLYGLLGLAIVIAVLGIVNTLALSVIERTREIGLLRAVGLGRGQLRRMIRLESVAIALLGSVLGVVMGLLSATALQRVMSGEGLTHLDIPVTQVVGFLAVAVLVGILAAVWPAFRAARLNVLDAISTE